MIPIILITAAIVFIAQEFRYAACEVEQDFFHSEISECKRAVIQIINSCRTPEQALNCKQLINLFQAQFHNREGLIEAVEDMWDKLDIKYRALTQIGLSEMTIDSLLK